MAKKLTDKQLDVLICDAADDPRPERAQVMQALGELKALRFSHRNLINTLVQAEQCIVYCRRYHPDVQKGSGLPIEAVINGVLKEARRVEA